MSNIDDLIRAIEKYCGNVDKRQREKIEGEKEAIRYKPATRQEIEDRRTRRWARKIMSEGY